MNHWSHIFMYTTVEYIGKCKMNSVHRKNSTKKKKLELSGIPLVDSWWSIFHAENDVLNRFLLKHQTYFEYSVRCIHVEHRWWFDSVFHLSTWEYGIDRSGFESVMFQWKTVDGIVSSVKNTPRIDYQLLEELSLLGCIYFRYTDICKFQVTIMMFSYRFAKYRIYLFCCHQFLEYKLHLHYCVEFLSFSLHIFWFTLYSRAKNGCCLALYHNIYTSEIESYEPWEISSKHQPNTNPYANQWEAYNT